MLQRLMNLFHKQEVKEVKRKNGSQPDKVLRYLQEGYTLNPRQAYNLCGTFRLAAIIYDLQEQGFDIVNLHKKGKYALYRMNRKTG